MKIEIPDKLSFLYRPAPYKVIYGGRGKGASYGVADALLALGIERPLRWLCTRETQESMDESVHALLSSRIVKLGMQDYYEVERAKIFSKRWRGGSGSSDPLAGRYGFSFAGLRHNMTGIKSYEGFDGAWVEEAESVPAESWRILIPTMRKDPPAGPCGQGSEVWVTLNPKFDDDDSYVRWVISPPKGAVSVFMSWRDNPFFPQKLRAQMEEMREKDPDSCDHIFEGIPRSTVQNAVFPAEMKRLEMDQRITNIPYDPRFPVSVFFDIGMDTTAMWFAQSISLQIRLIDYYENAGKSIDHYISQMQQRGYVWGELWLPWDLGVQAKQMGSGRSIEQILRSFGFQVRISPRLPTSMDSINAARMAFPRCWFDGKHCETGLRALRRYQWGEPAKTGITTRKPLHDWASHGSSAFQYMAVNFKDPEPPETEHYEQEERRSWLA